jgi:hypothetical protein
MLRASPALPPNPSTEHFSSRSTKIKLPIIDYNNGLSPVTHRAQALRQTNSWLPGDGVVIDRIRGQFLGTKGRRPPCFETNALSWCAPASRAQESCSRPFPAAPASVAPPETIKLSNTVTPDSFGPALVALVG